MMAYFGTVLRWETYIANLHLCLQADNIQALKTPGGAVLIEGPKACGTTLTTQCAAQSEALDADTNARAAIGAGIPEIVLEGAVLRWNDEWQVVPALWNHIRRAIDARQADGHFILTGSAACCRCAQRDARRTDDTAQTFRILD